ncbi:LCP family protein [Streptacidiphilus sp. EB129]|uniref:LCP family protein n=1 Tax=Streptacidiphilus sp. EB129 TaxID=3156262 RepID=UPI0035155741
MPADRAAPDRRPRSRGQLVRRPLRRGVWVAGLLSGAVLATSGVGWTVALGLGDSISRVNVFGGLRNRPAGDGALNFLLVGTDERAGVPPDVLRALHAGGEACHCTDAMMLVHLSASGGQASVVSIPRDSYVDIPAHQDLGTGRQMPESMGKINAAYGMGGPPLTVQTVEQATGLHIDHYLQLNFLSFVSTVDALGGVPVCTDRPLHDPKSGLDLPAGTTRLDGAQALTYVRARYVDPSADLGRMRRQQKFVAQIIAQATSSGTLLNPLRLQGVMTAVLRSVKADESLSTQDLLTLAGRLKDLRPSSASFTTIPPATLNHPVPGWGETVLWDRPRAEALFAALRADTPLTPSAPPASPSPAPAATGAAGAARATGAAAAAEPEVSVPPDWVRVQVLNGAGVPGLGAAAEHELRTAGFATTGLPANAPGGTGNAQHTVIRYDPRWDESVKTLAAALPGAQLQAVPGLGRTLQVVLGKDYTGVRRVATAPTTAPTTAGSTGATTAGAPPPQPSPSTAAAAAGVDAARGDTVDCH